MAQNAQTFIAKPEILKIAAASLITIFIAVFLTVFTKAADPDKQLLLVPLFFSQLVFFSCIRKTEKSALRLFFYGAAYIMLLGLACFYSVMVIVPNLGKIAGDALQSPFGPVIAVAEIVIVAFIATLYYGPYIIVIGPVAAAIMTAISMIIVHIYCRLKPSEG